MHVWTYTYTHTQTLPPQLAQVTDVPTLPSSCAPLPVPHSVALILMRAAGLGTYEHSLPLTQAPSLPLYVPTPQQLQATAQLGVALGLGWVTQGDSCPSGSLADLSLVLPKEPMSKSEVGLGVGDKE